MTIPRTPPTTAKRTECRAPDIAPLIAPPTPEARPTSGAQLLMGHQKPSRERPRSMARDHKIIHAAGLHRESIASGCSACLTLCLPEIEAAHPCHLKYRHSHTSDNGARGGLGPSESVSFRNHRFETSSVDTTSRQGGRPTTRHAHRRRLAPSLRRNRGIASEVGTARSRPRRCEADTLR